MTKRANDTKGKRTEIREKQLPKRESRQKGEFKKSE